MFWGARGKALEIRFADFQRVGKLIVWRIRRSGASDNQFSNALEIHLGVSVLAGVAFYLISLSI